ncbi:MAG TPA: hypothetical protein VFU06_00070 [Longimicrobiales bacterium]|nr:hypothetical protein [Longimicrobiales bacterium]
MASKEYERLRAALVYAASDHGKNLASIHATAADQDATAASLTAARAALDAEFEALLDTLYDVTDYSVDFATGVLPDDDPFYAAAERKAIALLRKHGRLP